MAFHAYDNREKLAEALALGVAAVLAGGIATRGSALLAVSGGSTPALFFERLSQVDIEWAKVTITLVDERFVLPQSPRSNAGMVYRHLLKGHALAANFLPLVSIHGDFLDNLAALERTFATLAVLDAAILGMGTDGHTASFFPGGDHLAQAIDPAGKHRVIAMNAPGAGEPRITLALPYLLEARLLALHVEGAEKRRVLDAALAGGPLEAMPVRAVLAGAKERLQIFWAP